MDLEATLKQAEEAVEGAGLSPAYKDTAFRVIAEHLLMADAAKETPPARTPERPLGPAPDDRSSGIDVLAEQVGLPVAAISEVYDNRGDGLDLIVASSKLPAGRSAGSKEIALLVAGGRQFGGWETWTASETIREVCRDYGRFDSPNFASSLNELGDVFSYRGKGAKREVKVTRPGLDRLRDLINRLTDGG